MTKPTFPVFGIIKNVIISVFLGGILGLCIGFIINILKIFTGGNQLDYNTVITITGILTFIILSYSTISDYNKEIEEFEKKENEENKKKLEKEEFEKNIEINRKKREEREKQLREQREKEERIRLEEDRVRKEKLEKFKIDSISLLDKDGDGNIDLVDSDSFSKILNIQQNKIIEIDKTYIQKFVKISVYLSTKKKNIQKLFNTIKYTKDGHELQELIGLLKNQVHTYNILIFHSISMVTSLVESNLITFYEIYECFDKVGVFNSNWENEVSSNLQKINTSVDEVNKSIIRLDINMSKNLQNLMFTINEMEQNLVNSISELTYITQDSFNDLNRMVERQLVDINSSINFNNLLTGIQTYQMYKINKNTRRIH